MKSKVRDVEDVRVIELEGRIAIGTGDVKLRELVQQALDEGRTRIVIDLAKVSSIDSSGIGEMVAAYTTVTRRGGRLALARLSPRIDDVLQVTQLITVLDVFSSVEEAIAALR